ncbi:hypothetical protein CUU66_01020 [Peribacillus deserti]|uniref:Uncharacterized protein n=1 Tax=Peribacillus deserti TaxID=673318 RepID=A0A2N5MBR1_9BACI|nr:hypothetical protein CUU66_01020 [Peribacillus deserti]
MLKWRPAAYKARYNWRRFRIIYIEMLLNGCLDQQMKAQLISKLEYHKNKMNDLVLSRAPF